MCSLVFRQVVLSSSVAANVQGVTPWGHFRTSSSQVTVSPRLLEKSNWIVSRGKIARDLRFFGFGSMRYSNTTSSSCPPSDMTTTLSRSRSPCDASSSGGSINGRAYSHPPAYSQIVRIGTGCAKSSNFTCHSCSCLGVSALSSSILSAKRSCSLAVRCVSCADLLEAITSSSAGASGTSPLSPSEGRGIPVNIGSGTTQTVTQSNSL